VVEDALGVQRRVRISVPSFHSVGVVVEHSALLATVPRVVARMLMARHPRLKAVKPPFSLGSGSAPMELLWRGAVEDDEALRFIRERIVEIARDVQPAAGVLSSE
jgi:LysR family transcriptional activator of mexEF-oprN operon